MQILSDIKGKQCCLCPYEAQGESFHALAALAKQSELMNSS